MTERIRVWVIRTDTEPETAEAYQSLLDPTETAHADDFLHDRDRHRYLVAHGARRVILGRELHQEPRSLTFTVDANGKPELTAGRPHISLAPAP